MNVFNARDRRSALAHAVNPKVWITLFVIVAAGFMTPSAHALWHYRMHLTVAPVLTKTRTLYNPTVAQIQNAIAPNTLVVIKGSVKASDGGTLRIETDDVKLDFTQASQVNWSGEDTWDGFLNISGNRVRVEGLRFQVSGNRGRCRGITIMTPATDVRIANCRFNWTSDGVVADGNWARVVLRDVKLLNCGNWIDENMPGGYGIFMEDDDHSRDDLFLINVKITLAHNAGQHGIRLSQVERVRIHNCDVTANQKRSLWAYGVDCMAVTRSTFRKGSVLFNLTPDEWYTDRPVSRVRIDACRIVHTGILEPLNIYCGHGTRYITMRDLAVTSTSSEKWIGIGWRGNGDPESEHIRWYDGSVTFNGRTVSGRQNAKISDWSISEQNECRIGPMHDPR